MKTPQNVSKSVRKRNPHLYSDIVLLGKWNFVTGEPKPPKRIRQSTKPLMNKLEQEWLHWLESKRIANAAINVFYKQAITFRLANGLRYTPDVFAFDWYELGELERPTAWEVKGTWFTDDANAKLKMFATAYPEIRVVLVWKDKGAWHTQVVLP